MRRQNVDFAPVSEFGIGFLSCFLLADRVEVETAMWEPMRGDIRKRHLEIDGPTRLIRIRETANEGLKRFKGTRISLHLTRGTEMPSKRSESASPGRQKIEAYLRDVCLDLPYRLNLDYVTAEGRKALEPIDPRPLEADVPEQYIGRALRVPVGGPSSGFEGQVAFVPQNAILEIDGALFEASPVKVDSEEARGPSRSVLLRGGFNVGEIPGLPRGYPGDAWTRGCVRLLWKSTENRRYGGTNLARTSAVGDETIGSAIFESWLKYLIDHRSALPNGFMASLDMPRIETEFGRPKSLAEFSWLEHYDAFALYQLARNGWHYETGRGNGGVDALTEWEACRGRAELPSGDLYSNLLRLVLPRVAQNRVLDEEGRLYVLAPVADWVAILRSWRTFLSNPVRWRPLARYTGRISEHLFHSRANVALNEKFSERFGSLSPDELSRLPSLLDRLLMRRGTAQTSQLTQEDNNLLQRAIDAAGDLDVSYFHKVWRLDSFRKKD